MSPCVFYPVLEGVFVLLYEQLELACKGAVIKATSPGEVRAINRCVHRRC